MEFRSYANLVSDQLVAHGWRQQSFNTADVAVFLQYQISQGREVAFSYPVFGPVPFGPATTTGRISTSGSASTFTATTHQNTAVGVVGTGSGSRVDYDRAVQLTMYSAPAYRESKRMERLYEATIRSSGTTGDLAAVMPTLVRGLLQDFPGASGGSRSVFLLIK